MKSYNILNGGLDQLQKDLNDYINQLSSANSQLVSELSNLAKSDIQQNAYISDEAEQALDLYSRTQVVQGRRSKNVASDRIVNTSRKVAFAEFGYGVVGANSPYAHSDFLDRYAIGWQGYDIDTPNKLPNRAWFYRDMFGEKKYTFGALPKDIFYNAGQRVLREFPKYASSIFGRLK